MLDALLQVLERARSQSRTTCQKHAAYSFISSLSLLCFLTVASATPVAFLGTGFYKATDVNNPGLEGTRSGRYVWWGKEIEYVPGSSWSPSPASTCTAVRCSS